MTSRNQTHAPKKPTGRMPCASSLILLTSFSAYVRWFANKFFLTRSWFLSAQYSQNGISETIFIWPGSPNFVVHSMPAAKPELVWLTGQPKVNKGSFHVRRPRVIYLTVSKIHEISKTERSHHSDFKTFWVF